MCWIRWLSCKVCGCPEKIDPEQRGHCHSVCRNSRAFFEPGLCQQHCDGAGPHDLTKAGLRPIHLNPLTGDPIHWTPFSSPVMAQHAWGTPLPPLTFATEVPSIGRAALLPVIRTGTPMPLTESTFPALGATVAVQGDTTSLRPQAPEFQPQPAYSDHTAPESSVRPPTPYPSPEPGFNSIDDMADTLFACDPPMQYIRVEPEHRVQYQRAAEIHPLNHWIRELGYEEPEQWELWRGNPLAPDDTDTYDLRRQLARMDWRMQAWPLPLPYEDFETFQARRINARTTLPTRLLLRQYQWMRANDESLASWSTKGESPFASDKDSTEGAEGGT